MNPQWGDFSVVPFVAVIAALLVLFMAALRVPMPRRRGLRLLLRSTLALGAVAAVFLGNIALYRNDMHLDVTMEKAFTPSKESANVVKSLNEDVEVIYFYKRDDPGGRAARTMIELMGRMSPHLQVRAIDPDQNPALANTFGMRMYNAAIILSAERRIEVITTDDREVALGILRATRASDVTLCFLTGHGEYDIDNFAFHTHFEGQHSHSHTSHGQGVIQMQQHGIGRVRRALDKLGLASRKIVIATGAAVPDDCVAVVEANPRTPFGPHESRALGDYLANGGSLMLLLEPDFPVDAGLADLLARIGIRYGDGVLVDPTDHYFTDEQMIAVKRYAKHPATRSLDLSFFPGARPLQALPSKLAQVTALATSSPSSYVQARRLQAAPASAPADTGVHALAIAAEGRLGGGAARPFRVVAFGDADFASNSFYPYMSNADLLLGVVSWLIHEERAPAMKPVVEVLPTVNLTNSDVTLIFVLTVFVVPGGVALVGGAVWWRRRR